MAKKSSKKTHTPIMALSMFALFALMIPMFAISNTNRQTRESRAQVVPTSTPEAVEVMMEK